MGNKKLNRIYFVGIGGIGMSAIARYYLALGYEVAGYDKVATPLTSALVQEGASVHFDDSVALIPEGFQNAESTLVIYTPAIPADHSELNYFRTNGFEVIKRSQALGVITQESHSIAVAGTHGKTTTSSIVAHLLVDAAYPVNAFLGGICTNFESNYVVNEFAKSTVVEADEYDRSFLTLSPNTAIVTSMDADHLDIYGEHDYLKESFMQFVDKLPEDGVLIKKKGLPVNAEKTIEYSASEEADYYATNINIQNGDYHFDLMTPEGEVSGMQLGTPGLHNVENAIAAVAAARDLGVSFEEIRKGLKSFRGVKRRFEYHIREEEMVYIDDYAHHPEELKACIGSVKEMYPAKKITGVFQPHLFSRTRDFADGFAKSLEMLDEVILLDIYPARELPIEGVTSEMLLEKIEKENKELLSKEELVGSIKDRKLEVLLTLGAGDIDQLIEPIKNELVKKN